MSDILTQQKFFDELACEWDQLNDSNKIQRIEHLLVSRIPRLSGPILDVGSGTGILVPLLGKLNGHYVFELDVARNMLKTARSKMKSFNQHCYINADAHHIPCSGASFGTVFCFCVYPHFHNPALATSEIHRVLKNGGRIVIMHLMNHHELNAMHASKSDVVAQDVLPPAERLSGELEHHGFRIEQAEEEEGLYLLIGSKKAYPAV